MKNRTHLSIFLAIFLVITVASQAALAFSMPCRGTSDCCCVTPAMDMSAAMPTGMGQNCCETTPEKSCDIETTMPGSAAPYLSSTVAGSVDLYGAFQPAAFAVDSADSALNSVFRSRDLPDRGRPPIYLQKQSFLC